MATDRPNWDLDCQRYSTQRSNDLRYQRKSVHHIIDLSHDERARMIDPDFVEREEREGLQEHVESTDEKLTREKPIARRQRQRLPGDVGFDTTTLSKEKVIDFHSKVKSKIQTRGVMGRRHAPAKVQSYHLPNYKTVKPRIDSHGGALPQRSPVKVEYAVVRRRPNVPVDSKPMDVKELYRRRRALQREATQNALNALRRGKRRPDEQQELAASPPAQEAMSPPPAQEERVATPTQVEEVASGDVLARRRMSVEEHVEQVLQRL
eukprot:TRINITY_DN10133_c0_g3_i2.p1 TRINITY_DN10133_c0_g3~~TRINITY_DN10133_c0_g3_i2.p1  ORF type:complete len:264 (+),score=42.93 TRINITY_DN10133_c0_g3_i2:136-927(+)